MKYYLGLDLSTQQLKCTLIDQEHAIVFEHAVNFGRDLPHYNTENGAVSHGNDVVTSPPLMWVEAMDMLLSRLAKTSYIPHIVAISGAGQVRLGPLSKNERTFILRPSFSLLSSRTLV